jgi:Circularly permutated YpsA SLOG family
LDAALELDFPCGGWCPAGRLAEDGKIPERYPVVELADRGYAERTAQNVADSDGTLIIVDGPLVGGTRETLQFCIEQRKPLLLIDLQTTPIDEAIAQALELVRTLSSRAYERDVSPDSSSSARLGMTLALNVAGPRASQWPQARDVAHEIVSAILRRLSGHSHADEYSA